jgi:hypothetical protein
MIELERISRKAKARVLGRSAFLVGLLLIAATVARAVYEASILE